MGAVMDSRPLWPGRMGGERRLRHHRPTKRSGSDLDWPKTGPRVRGERRVDHGGRLRWRWNSSNRSLGPQKGRCNPQRTVRAGLALQWQVVLGRHGLGGWDARRLWLRRGFGGCRRATRITVATHQGQGPSRRNELSCPLTPGPGGHGAHRGDFFSVLHID